MRKTFLAAATALSLVALPASAQQADAPLGAPDNGEDQRSVYTPDEQAAYDAMGADQRIAFDTWENDRQVLYFGWNDALRGYYWSLSPAQQEVWWTLDAEQRVDLFQMQDEDRRQLAWSRLMGNGAPNGDTARYVSEAKVQDVPANAPANGEYPVCKGDNDDGCINAWAAGKRGPGVDRPLEYWPGEDARGG